MHFGFNLNIDIDLWDLRYVRYRSSYVRYIYPQ